MSCHVRLNSVDVGLHIILWKSRLSVCYNSDDPINPGSFIGCDFIYFRIIGIMNMLNSNETVYFLIAVSCQMQHILSVIHVDIVLTLFLAV